MRIRIELQTGVLLVVLGLMTTPSWATFWSGEVGNSACSNQGGPNADFPNDGTPFGFNVCPEDNTSANATGPYAMKGAVKGIAGQVSKQANQAVRPSNMSGGQGRVDSSLGAPFAEGNAFRRETGLSAGDKASQIGLWGNYTYTDSGSDDSRLSFDGELNTALIGLDFSLSEQAALGVAISYENLDETTTFNVGTLESDGFGVIPYYAILLSDNFSVDVLAGYVWLDIDQNQSFKVSNLDATRFFTQFTLNGYANQGEWSFAGSLAALYAIENQDSFTESVDSTITSENRIELGQLAVTGEVSYSGQNLEPYATLSYEYDLIHEDLRPGASYDDNGFAGGLGLRFLLGDAVTGDLFGNVLFGRAGYDEHSIGANLRFAF